MLMCKSEIARVHVHVQHCLIFSLSAFGPGDAPSFVYGIAYYNQHIYFTDPGNRDIYRSDLNGDKSVYLGSYDYLSDLKVVQPLKGQSTYMCTYTGFYTGIV